jgi:DNA-binding transcriptional ArsR family regulator
MDEYRHISSTFAALADPTRRAILRQLSDGPSRVTALAQPHEISLNSVSKHLKILEKSKLVTREIRGREHWIEFNKAPLAEARDWADSMLEFWSVRFDALADLVAEENTKDRKNDD